MSLRLKINLIVGMLTALFVRCLTALQLDNLRYSIKKEVIAANRVAAQLLNRMVMVAASDGTPAMLTF